MSVFVRRFVWLLLVFCGAFFAAPSHAAPSEIAVSAQPVSIARGATQAFEFGNLPQKNTTALLKITSRLDSTMLAGSNFMMRLELNGQEVQVAKTRSAIRLKNRALDSPVAPGVPAPWFGSPSGWRVLYAPDFDGAKAQAFYEGDPYTLVLDVTDLLNPAAENRLEITNTAPAIATAAAQTKADLVVQSISLETIDGASPMMVSAATIKPFINTGERAGGPAKYTAQVAPGGGFIATVGKRQWKFDSAFSYPNAGFNRLTVAPQKGGDGQPVWKPTSQREPRGAQVTADAREYSLRRTMRFTPRKIEVSDAITNKTAAPLGMMVSHEMSLAGLESPPVRLAGNPDQTVGQYFAPGNPSVHVTAPDHSIAMLCEDDVFRNQARLFVRSSDENPSENVAGFRTEMLCLAPGETYTMRWSVYPVQSLDYFDFVNLVRQDWGANFTAQGAWWWGFSPDEVLAWRRFTCRRNKRR